MITEIEESKSDRAKCNRCGKLIGKGIPRGLETIHRVMNRSERYFCHKCTLQIIKEDIEQLKQLEVDLTKMVKDKNKEIIIWELENG